MYHLQDVLRFVVCKGAKLTVIHLHKRNFCMLSAAVAIMDVHCFIIAVAQGREGCRDE